jgi:2',3'-cyclic-nucleotide 2'-phosphodiesterase (5'-nucleotidase family)
VIRSQPTNLGKLIVAGMSAAAPAASVVLMNSGSIRVDDVLQMPLTEYDILRTLPFGGGISEVDMTGRLLVKVLDQGRKNSGNGGYLVYNNELTTGKEGQWLLNGAPIDAQSIYHVALAEFLLTGKEANLEFLHPGNPEIKKVYEAITSRADPRSDIRKALIQYLENK